MLKGIVLKVRRIRRERTAQSHGMNSSCIQRRHNFRSLGDSATKRNRVSASQVPSSKNFQRVFNQQDMISQSLLDLVEETTHY